jgi:predicted dehydrogenase
MARDRRDFLKKTLTAGAGSTAWLAGRAASAQTVASAAQAAGANDRIRLALIGCGGMGRSDLLAMLRTRQADCIALCDVDDTQSAIAALAIEEEGFRKPELVTRDYRGVLERKDVDAVVVGTPDHWHALVTIESCMAGKDVYCEKPLATSIAEGRAMVTAARRYDRVVQVGTQQRSTPHFDDAIRYLRTGELGKIRTVTVWAYLDWKAEIPVQPDEAAPATVDYDLWLGPAPKRPFNRNRFHFTFRWYWDYSGGLMTDWGAHWLDVANWGMQTPDGRVQVPTEIMSIGGKLGYPRDAMETPDTQQVLFKCADFSILWQHAIGIGRGPEAREHGAAFHGNNGVLVLDRNGWEVLPETTAVDQPRRYKVAGVPLAGKAPADGHDLHVRNFLDCVKSRQRPIADVEVGHESVTACHLGNIAYRTGRIVKWDPVKESVIGDPEAQKLASRSYRAPWKLPTLG